MKILLVAPYSSLPSDRLVNRFSYLAKNFAARGHQTTFVTSAFSHYEKSFRELGSQPEYENLEVVLIDEPGYRAHVGLKRVLSIRAFRKNFEARFPSFDGYDIVYSAYPTIGHNIYISNTINKNKTKFVVDVQDVWPESFSSVFPMLKNVSPQLLPFSRSANNVYSSADALIAVSQTYLERAAMVNRAAPGLTAYLGSEFDMMDNVPVKNGPTKLVYIGTLSYSYDIDTVIGAVHELSSSGHNVEFNIFGDGPDLKRLQGLPHVGTRFHGMVAYKTLEPKLREQHIAVNAIKGHARQSITNKLCDYFFLGCPILNTQKDTEVTRLVSEVVHRNYHAGDVASAKEAIEAMAQEKDLYKPWKCNPIFHRETISGEIVSFVENI